MAGYASIGNTGGTPAVQRTAAQRTRNQGRPGRPQGRPQGRPPKQGGQQRPSFIQETPGQQLARARQIVNSEVQAETLPYRQQAARLPGEEQGVQAAHTANYGQLDTRMAAQQAAQADSAKTFENVAADAVKKAEASNSGEKFGGGTPDPGSALDRQAQANRTLLQAIVAGSQAGTNARQQAESSYLTNLKGTAGMEAAAGTKAIQSEYGKAKQKNADEEARVRASKPGRVGKLFLGLQGEQEKLRIASQGLGVKTALAENTIKSGAATRAHTVKADKLAARKLEVDEGYKKASLPGKQLKDKLDIQKKEIDIKKALEGNPHKGSLSSDKVAEVSGQAAKAFNYYKTALQEGADPTEVRQQLEAGQARRGYEVKNKKTGKKETKYYTEHFSAVSQPVVITMAEEIYNKGYVGAQTKQELRELGLKDSGWSDHFYGGPRSATHGVTGGVKAGRKKK